MGGVSVWRVSCMGGIIAHVSDETTRMGLAVRVNAVRRGAGLTVEKLAHETGIPYSTLRRRLEKNPHQFTVDELARIAAATGVPFEALLVGAVAA